MRVFCVLCERHTINLHTFLWCKRGSLSSFSSLAQTNLLLLPFCKESLCGAPDYAARVCLFRLHRTNAPCCWGNNQTHSVYILFTHYTHAYTSSKYYVVNAVCVANLCGNLHLCQKCNMFTDYTYIHIICEDSSTLPRVPYREQECVCAWLSVVLSVWWCFVVFGQDDDSLRVVACCCVWGSRSWGLCALRSRPTVKWCFVLDIKLANSVFFPTSFAHNCAQNSTYTIHLYLNLFFIICSYFSVTQYLWCCCCSLKHTLNHKGSAKCVCEIDTLDVYFVCLCFFNFFCSGAEE